MVEFVESTRAAFRKIATEVALVKKNKVSKGDVELNVKDYGTFTANGSVLTGAADVACINAALIAAEATGATVVIPSWARIVVTAPTRANVITARKNVTLRSNGAIIKIADGSPVYNAVIGSNVDVSGFILDGVEIDQNKDNVATPTTAAFEYAFGVHLTFGTQLRVKNCVFRNCDGINTVVMNGSSGTNGVVNVDNVYINDNYFLNIGNDVNHDHSTVYTNCSRATITNNHFVGRTVAAKSAYCAIEVHGSSHRVTNNHIENYREAINATGIAFKTDTQVVANNTILNCLRGIRLFSQASGGTVSPGIRSMGVHSNSIVVNPEFWVAAHDLPPQGISFTSTTDLAVHALNIQNNEILFLSYPGTTVAQATLLAGGVVYSRTGGITNWDRGINVTGNTIIGALSGGVMFVGAKIQGLSVKNNIIVDCGHPILTTADDYRAGVGLISGEVVGASITSNRIMDTRAGGGMSRGITWFPSGNSDASVNGEIVDNAVSLVSGREVNIGVNTGGPFVRHSVRSSVTTATTTPTGPSAAGSSWIILATGVMSTQTAVPSGVSWNSTASGGTATLPDVDFVTDFNNSLNA